MKGEEDSIMKKIRGIITMLLLIGSLTACSGTSDEQSGAGDETGTETFRIYSLKDEYMVRQAASLFSGKISGFGSGI
jgi:uncharacterized lipoprotein YehR (DUF1307 family)